MNGRKTFFWASYADLMTSLFFVMLVLFTVAFGVKNVAQKEFEKIKDIKDATQNVDTTYFSYSPEYEKYILKIKVKYHTKQDSINDLSEQTREKLLEVGKAIRTIIESTIKKNPKVQYLLIIEGQASADGYEDNMELSYRRALGLFQFWKARGLDFGKNFGNHCEPLVCGSGEGGRPREEEEEKNQRFLIHLVPKLGTID